jgi:hypothetical protein
LSRLLEGLSGTGNKGEMFDHYLLNEKNKDHFIDEIVDIALFATWIPLSIFPIFSTRGLKSIQCWNQRLKYYSSSTFKWRHNQMTFTFLLEIIFLYTLRCIRCGQNVTPAGSIGETLLHAPTAMLYHWNLIQSHDKENHRESILMPLLFNSYDNYL